MPEYVAEASLYKSGWTWRGAVRHTSGRGAIPNRAPGSIAGANARGSINNASKPVGIRRRDLRTAARPRATSTFERRLLK